MSRRFKSYAENLFGLISPAVVLAIWEIAGMQNWVNPILLPRPSQIIQTLIGLIVDGAIAEPLTHTLALFAVGYSLASMIGVVVGVAMASSRTLYGVLEPFVEIMRPIPKSALVPVLFLFLGIGKATMITIVVLGAVFPTVISTFQGVRNLDPVLLETARTFQTSRLRTIFQVVLPASLPMIFAGMRVGLGLGLVLVILAEMLAGETGLGFRILDLQRSFQIKDMFAWIFVLVALGGGLTILFNSVENGLIPWRGKA
jgi:ABC-type nitrate/sulfonate/bicarbonate transport system permease component